jgi:hypothetical protein
MSKILDNIARQKLNLALKQFTRAKALRAITADNCSEDRFTKHPNKHVKARAAHLAAKVADAAPVTEREETVEEAAAE